MRVAVHGHRGARAARPENTLAAFEYALRIGVDVLELDLGVSADDRLVVLHDPAVNPELCQLRDGQRLDRPLPVRTLKLAQLARFDCGSLRHPRFPQQQLAPGARIPTLEDVLRLVARSRHRKARTVQLNIETKLVPGRPELAPSPQEFARLVVRVLERHRMLHRAMLQSFDHRTLLAAHRLAPALRLVVLTGESRPDYVAVARAAHARIVSPHRLWITRADVQAIHRAGLQVVPWTANEAAEWKRLVDLGVDGIITDDPAGLIGWLRQRNPLPRHQRGRGP